MLGLMTICKHSELNELEYCVLKHIVLECARLMYHELASSEGEHSGVTWWNTATLNTVYQLRCKWTYAIVKIWIAEITNRTCNLVWQDQNNGSLKSHELRMSSRCDKSRDV